MSKEAEAKLKLIINTSSGIPVYIQIADNIKAAIALGILQKGKKLPSVRELSAEININPNTISKAYQKLTSEGVINIEKGIGAYVCNIDPGNDLGELKSLIKILIEKARRKGLTLEKVIRLIEEDRWDD